MMSILRLPWAVLTSRFLWVLIGLLLLSAVVWMFGPLVSIGGFAPLESAEARLLVIGSIFLIWLIRIVVRRWRAMTANRIFVAEIAAPQPEKASPGDENVSAVDAKFQDVMAELKKRKLGSRKFLREMPWYLIIGAPATGKTTALKQAGLNFPIDLGDSLQGVGGTRNCDWFFTEDAVLIDTAGRYVQQQSQPDVDAAEWLGFLDLLKKHRGERALNGVIVALSVDVLSEGDESIKTHARAIRKRLAEAHERLEIRLPVYLMLTKADLIKGFEPFFSGLSTSQREQVWGATFAPGARVDGAMAAREIVTLSTELEKRLTPRLENEEQLSIRAEIFRFPTQLESLTEPIRKLVDEAFGESRYEEAPWLRGIYLTSATQEGAPIDRLTAQLSSSFGLPAPRAMAQRRIDKRSFFLKNLLTEVIFKEAGLGTFDPLAIRRREWIWRGAAAASVLGVLVAGTVLLFSYLSNRSAIAEQATLFEALREPLIPLATAKAPVQPLDLDIALAAADAVVESRTQPPGGALGISTAAEIGRAQADAYEKTVRNLLEPRMVALLEATMWRQIRDPDYLVGALKTYRMMTGLSQMDTDFAEQWWLNELPKFAPIQPFPTQEAADHQIVALSRMVRDESYIEPDKALVGEALKSICSIPLPQRAYRTLLADRAVTELKEWVPANVAGPNAAKVLSRRSGKTLRIGIPGAFTYAAFHDVILDRVEDVAAQAALDRSVFAGGCSENSETSIPALSGDILKLYYEDFIAQWDSFLRDVRLAPLTSLQTASENLKDLSSADSSMKRLLTAVVRETDLTRDDDGETPGNDKQKKAAASKILSKFGKIGRLAKQGVKLLPKGGAAAETDMTGTPVAEHFKPLKATIAEVDGQAPMLDATVAALTQLSNMLQTVSANPHPDEAIKRQGGLGELVGAVARQAQTLPDPIDDWLAGIAGDTTGLAEKAVVSQLNAIWRADILPFCSAALSKRYPFDASSAIDVNIRDFARLFGPGGMIDGYINDHLLAYVDTSRKPWKWRADFGLNPNVLVAFEQARQIRDELFAGGSGPIMSFTLEPKDLSPSAARVTLNLDGQIMSYFNNATRPQPMTWPGKDGTGVITLAFQPVDGSPEVIVSETGSWAWLRMLRSGQFASGSLPEAYKLRLAARGHYADFELRASSVENPYDLKLFAKFICPENL